MSKKLTFEDLEFKQHPGIPNGVHAVAYFENEHRISVVGGNYTYGDGVDTFEVWRSCDSDVIGYQTKEQITELMSELQDFPKGVGHNDLGF